MCFVNDFHFAELDIYVLNIEDFGYSVKTQEYDDMAHAVRSFVNFKLKTLVNHPPVQTSQYLNSTPSNDTVGVDKVRRKPHLFYVKPHPFYVKPHLLLGPLPRLP